MRAPSSWPGGWSHLRRCGGQGGTCRDRKSGFVNFERFARLRKLPALPQLLPTFSKILLGSVLCHWGVRMKEKAEPPPLPSRKPSWILPAPTHSRSGFGILTSARAMRRQKRPGLQSKEQDWERRGNQSERESRKCRFIPDDSQESWRVCRVGPRLPEYERTE